jgi:hypothetical protein
MIYKSIAGMEKPSGETREHQLKIGLTDACCIPMNCDKKVCNAFLFSRMELKIDIKNTNHKKKKSGGA